MYSLRKDYSDRRPLSSRLEDASAADGADLSLSLLREEASLDDDGLLGEMTTTEDLEDALGGAVDHGDLVALLVVLAHVVRHQSPQLVDVDGRDEVLVDLVVEASLTELAEVARVVSVEEGSVVMEATSVTATRLVLAVLA